MRTSARATSSRSSSVPRSNAPSRPWPNGTTGGPGPAPSYARWVAQSRPPDEILPDRAAQALYDFVVDIMPERMARETSLDIRSTNHPSYEWLLLHGELMTSVPVIPFLWDRWWRLDQTGLMVAGVQWVSCLVYADRDNPVFAASAGGAQFLPEPSTTGLPAPAANVAFLEATLSYQWALGRATALLERLGLLFAALSEIGSWHAFSTWGDP